MRCNLRIEERETPKLKKRAVGWFSWLHLKTGVVSQKKYESLPVCDGEIKVRVFMEYEFYGNDAYMKTEFKCEKCGGQYYPHLESLDIDTILTKAVAEMDDAPLILARLQKEEQATADQMRWREQEEARMEAERVKAKARAEKRKQKKRLLVLFKEGWRAEKTSLFDEEGVEGWLWSHPDGREYSVIGDWQADPEIPAELE